MQLRQFSCGLHSFVKYFPCKIRTGILAGSRRDLGGNLVGIPARFWPPGFFFPAGISPGNVIPGGQNLAGILPRISPRFSPGSKNPGGQNLAGILPRIFSPGSKNPGGQNLAGILPRILPRFSPGSNNPGGQNLAGMLPRISPRFSPRSKFTVAKNLSAILPGILPRLATGSEILGEIHCGNLDKILDMLPRVSFGSSAMFTCFKIQTKVGYTEI